MTEQRAFVVRPLPGSALDGAFRVHLAPDALEKLGLKVGDLCHIISDNNPSGGYGIAWRATDKMGNAPRLRPAKMSDILRSAFNLKEGSHVSIEKTKARVVHADKLTLTDVTPTATNTPSSLTEAADDNCWLLRCAYLLGTAEAVTIGMTFDVDSRKKPMKKRFYVDRIESKDARPGEPALFTCDDNTKIVLNDGRCTTPAHIVLTVDSPPRLDSAHIGGLLQQIKELNKRLDRVLNKPLAASTHMPWNQHILVHGYEGTGKTLILNRLELASVAKTFRLDKAHLPTGTPTKNLATIQQTFRDALSSQPSLVLMDNLDRLAPPDDEVYSPLLQNELDGLRGSRVLVVASARSLTSFDAPLRRAGRFSAKIELPIPDIDARRQILNVLSNKQSDSDDPITTAVSLKTHGFTPNDLALLIETAQAIALDRLDETRGEWINIQARASLVEASSPSQFDGSVHSQDSTEGENATSRLQMNCAQADETDTELTLGDFEIALQEVGPTALREIFLETPKVGWSDIGGSENIKKRFDEIIGWPLYYADILEAYQLRPQKGILLYGPPGCSKTLTAQAVATTYDLNFIAVKGAELISMYVGESERAVREVFRKARQAAPCVIFFDEIDSIGAERDNSGTKGLNVLTTLLNEMDGFETMKGVMVLAATNKPEILDPALLRPGRFDSHVYLGPPDASARKAIIDIGMKTIQVANNVRFDDLVTATEGYSGAEIVRVCDLAKQGAIRRMTESQGDGKPNAEDFDAALAQTDKGIAKHMLEAYEAFAHRGA